MRKKYIFPVWIVTFAEELLRDTPVKYTEMKIKYMRCASDIFETYLKTIKSLKFFRTSILHTTVMQLLFVEILFSLNWCDFRNLFLKFVEITCIR